VIDPDRQHCTSVSALEKYLGDIIDELEKHFNSRIIATEKLNEEREDRNKERFANAERGVLAALASVDKAITKAEAAENVRYASLNELRGALTDQTARLLTRDEYGARHETLSNSMNQLIERLTKVEALGLGKAAGIGLVGTIILGGITTVSAMAAIGTVLITLLRFSGGH